MSPLQASPLHKPIPFVKVISSTVNLFHYCCTICLIQIDLNKFEFIVCYKMFYKSGRASGPAAYMYISEAYIIYIF